MSNSLRILLVSGEYPPMQGGVADYTRIIAHRMADRGHEVQVLCSRRASSETPNVTAHAIMPDWRWPVLKRTLSSLCDTFSPEVINIQYQTAAFGMRPAINLVPRMGLPTPVVTTFHDLLVPFLFPKAGALRWLANLSLAKSSAAVITTNPADTSRLVETEGLRHVHEIPIGSNIQPYLPDGFDRRSWRARWGLEPDDSVLCYFGFMNQSKGGLDLIQALALLVKENPNTRLLLIGGATGTSDPTNEAYAARMHQLIAESQLGEHVRATGHIPDEEVSAAFACADVCVLPFQDGISLRRGSLMAALVHGMPVVSTQPLVTMPEIVHGQNVWLARREQPDDLAQSIGELLSSDELRHKLSVGALALAKRYDWDTITTRILEVYRDVRQT